MRYWTLKYLMQHGSKPYRAVVLTPSVLLPKNTRETAQVFLPDLGTRLNITTDKQLEVGANVTLIIDEIDPLENVIHMREVPQ